MYGLALSNISSLWAARFIELSSTTNVTMDTEGIHFIVLFPSPLEEVLQRELHDPRVARRRHLTERIAVEIGGRIIEVNRVGHIECFGAELNLLSFPQLERSGESHVELPRSRTENAAAAHTAEGTERREPECRRAHVIACGFVAVRVETDLVHALVSRAVQRPILCGRDRHEIARED